MTEARRCRAFISYSHDSDEHRGRVVQLAQDLRRNGVDAVLDRFVTCPAEGWPRWMQAQVRDSDFVLCVCTATYSRRFEDREGQPGVGKGALHEGLLIAERIYDAQSHNDFAIPILFDGADESDIPLVLRPATRYCMPTELLPLLRRMKDRPELVPVPVVPHLPPLEDCQVVSDGAITDANDEFLERVVEVCRLREESERRTVEIRLQQGPPPFKQFAEVRRTSPYREAYALAALLSAPDTKSLEVFRTELHESYRKSDPGTRSWLVCGGRTPGQDLVREAESVRIQVVPFLVYAGLIDFRPYVDSQTTRLSTDQFYSPSLYVNQHVSWTEFGGTSRAEDAVAKVREWLRVPWGQFVVLLGESGSGKTFTLRELARRMGMEDDPVVPVLLEMKGLQKARTLDQLVGPHFIEALGRFDKDAFRYMLRDGRIALLFDGFDELAVRVSYEKAKEHFGTLLEAAGGHAKIVVAIRAQFLPKSEVMLALSTNFDKLSSVRVADLAPFTEGQIRDYLERKLGDKSRVAARLGLLQKNKGLRNLASNPRMLSFIVAISDQELGESITTAGVYLRIVNRWLEFEHKRANPRGGAPGLEVEHLWRAVCDLALRMWTSRVWAVPLVDQPEDVRAILEGLHAPTGMTGDETAFQVGSGTLLARDEDGRFTFLDDTLVEFLVGCATAEELLGNRSGVRAFEQTWSPTDLMTDAFLETVHARLEPSLTELPRSVQAFLSLCACFSPTEVRSSDLPRAGSLPEELSALLNDEQALSAAIDHLQRLRLASVTEDGLRVHPLMRALILSRLPETERRMWFDLALTIVEQVFPADPERPERWPDCVRLLSQTLAVASNAEGLATSRKLAAIYDRVGRFQFARGEYESALQSFTRALTEDGNLPDLWPALWSGNLGAAMVACDSFEAAVTHLTAALDADRQALGDDHRHLAPVHANLGYALAAVHRGDEALEHLLAAAKLLSGVHRPGYLQAFWLDGIGVELLAQGSAVAALRCLESATTGRAPENSDDRPLLAVRKWTMARALRMSDQQAKAQHIWNEADTLWRDATVALKQVGGDEATASAFLMRHDLEQSAGRSIHTRSAIKTIVDSLAARRVDIVQRIEALKLEQRGLKAEYRSTIETQAWPEGSVSTQSQDDLEVKIDEVQGKLERMTEELKGVERVAAGWRAVMSAFVIRCALRAEACGLCPDRCVLTQCQV